MARPARKKIGIERQDHVGPGHVVHRVDIGAEGQLGPGAGAVGAGRLILVPARGGKRRQQGLDLRRERRGGHRLGQHPQTGAVLDALKTELVVDGHLRRGPAAGTAVLQHGLRPVRVVQGQYRRLRECVRGAEAGRVLGISLDLGRPPEMALDQEPGGVAGQRHRGRIEEWLAGDELLRSMDIGNDLPRGCAGARGEAGQSQGRAHDLQQVAPVDVARPGRLQAGKLVVQELPELVGVRKLLEAAPVIPAAECAQALPDCPQIKSLSLGQFVAHRWQV